MALKSSCDECGRTVLGIVGKLERVGSSYVCAACLPAARRAGAPLRLAYRCPRCGTTSDHADMRGNGWIEAVLYLLYLAPGIVYSVWRRSRAPDVCPACHTAGVVRVDHAT